MMAKTRTTEGGQEQEQGPKDARADDTGQWLPKQKWREYCITQSWQQRAMCMVWTIDNMSVSSGSAKYNYLGGGGEGGGGLGGGGEGGGGEGGRGGDGGGLHAGNPTEQVRPDDGTATRMCQRWTGCHEGFHVSSVFTLVVGERLGEGREEEGREEEVMVEAGWGWAGWGLVEMVAEVEGAKLVVGLEVGEEEEEGLEVVEVGMAEVEMEGGEEEGMVEAGMAEGAGRGEGGKRLMGPGPVRLHCYCQVHRRRIPLGPHLRRRMMTSWSFPKVEVEMEVVETVAEGWKHQQEETIPVGLPVHRKPEAEFGCASFCPCHHHRHPQMRTRRKT